MSKITFMNAPAYGHVIPTLPLVQELVKRGHTLEYYCTDEFRERISATGARYRPLPTHLDLDMGNHAGDVFWLCGRMLQMSGDILPALLETLGHEPPDLLMYDAMCVWARYLRHCLHLPTLATYPTFALHPKMLPPSLVLLLTLGARRLNSGWRHWQMFRQAADSLKGTYGLSLSGVRESVGSPGDLNLVFTSEQFQPKREMFDTSYQFVGPCLADRPTDPDFPLDRLTGRRVVYVSLGTVFNDNLPFFQTCLKALAGSEYTVVMSIGKRVNMTDLGDIPANFIARPFVPQLAVLQHAAVFVTHGGMNSVSEGLMHQVPLVMCPQSADQFFVTRRVETLDAGCVIRNGVSPAALRAKVEQALDDTRIRQGVERLAHSLKDAGGTCAAADQVEQFIAERCAA